MKTILYKLFLGFYHIFPGQIFFCKIIRSLGIRNPKIINDLIFKGTFNVNDYNGSFKIKSYGGGIAHSTFWHGLFVDYEADTGWLWLKFAPKCKTILDVGANTGIYSLTAKALNPTAEVYAFEPSKNTYHKLIENNKINNFDIVCLQNAVSSQNGSLTFYDVPNEFQTSASLSPDKLKNWQGYDGDVIEYDVSVVSLDSFTESYNLESIDLVKIDVELHEPDIIKGFIKGLDKFKPIIFIEVLEERIAMQLNEIFDLEQYHIYHLKAKGKIVKHEKFTRNPDLWNYVVLHKDKKAFFDSIVD